MRRTRKPLPIVRLTIDKLVHGGQGMGRTSDGMVVFAWNALPGEDVDVQLTKKKKNYAEGFVVDVHTKSADRIGDLRPTDVELSACPWSIMSYAAELKAKAQILNETFAAEGVEIVFDDIHTKGHIDGYRNKVEFSFYGDEKGLHYAHYVRASHQKTTLVYPYTPLINDQIAVAADVLLRELNVLGVRAGDLKSVIIRSDSEAPGSSKVALALFAKTEEFPSLKTPDLVVYYSDPRSPASLPTRELYRNGTTTLSDTVRGSELAYDVLSFFQVNLPIFEVALEHIEQSLGGMSAVDMYSGVGSIGLSVSAKVTKLIESDQSNIEFARQNAGSRDVEIVHAPSEQALEYITGDEAVIVDPPRSGLHKDVVSRLTAKRPPKIVYLSCNPSTQARDVRLLQDAGFKVTRHEGYNFFPRTPHIESLIVLE